ncbi:MAG: hypothetical protein KC423_08285 [Anaerolineales bacterium]|nr:hypothetical protein [Anaerolineales bacterium]
MSNGRFWAVGWLRLGVCMEAELSPQLLAAQQALAQRREALARARAESGQRPFSEPATPPTAVSWELYNGQQALAARRQQEGITVAQEPDARREEAAETAVSPTPALDHTPPNTEPTIKVYPTLATAVLQANLTAAGRVYWLLRHLDPDGRGWLDVAQLRETLTRPTAPLRVCGWRRLRQLLQEGEGKLWERDAHSRLWLFSPARILAQLGHGRLQGQPVALPVSKLLGGVGEVRAYLYATFHAGRRQPTPISRAAIASQTAVSASSQRRYEQRAHITSQRNIALGSRHNQMAQEQSGWVHGRATFTLVDGNGLQGTANGRYLAWRLGNSYHTPLTTTAKGRQKKLNRHCHLVNDGRGVQATAVERQYYPHGKATARGWQRTTATTTYYPAP